MILVDNWPEFFPLTRWQAAIEFLAMVPAAAVAMVPYFVSKSTKDAKKTNLMIGCTAALFVLEFAILILDGLAASLWAGDTDAALEKKTGMYAEDCDCLFEDARCTELWVRVLFGLSVTHIILILLSVPFLAFAVHDYRRASETNLQAIEET